MGSINKLGNYKVAISLDGYWVLSKSKETLVVQNAITGEIQRTLTKRQVNKKSTLKCVNLSAKSIDRCWAILGFVDNTFGSSGFMGISTANSNQNPLGATVTALPCRQ